MNNDTNKSALPSLISDVLTDQYQCIDNLFANTWKTLRLNTLLRSAGFSKRSGLQVTQAVFLLLLWKWLAVSSIAMFSRKAMGTFCDNQCIILRLRQAASRNTEVSLFY